MQALIEDIEGRGQAVRSTPRPDNEGADLLSRLGDLEGMAKRTRTPPRFDLVETAEWISDRTEIDVEIALEILEAEYGYLRGSGVAGAAAAEGHHIIASREQVLAVASRVPLDEETVRAVLDAFMEYLRTKGYVKEIPASGPASSG